MPGFGRIDSFRPSNGPKKNFQKKTGGPMKDRPAGNWRRGASDWNEETGCKGDAFSLNGGPLRPQAHNVTANGGGALFAV